MATTMESQRNLTTGLSQLSKLLSQSPQMFLRPTLDVQQAALQAAKLLLDPLASGTADAQTTRRNENRKKRKRGDHEEEEPILQLRQVYTKGFAVKQVWEQAKRILDAAQLEVERDIDLHQSLVRPSNKDRNITNGVLANGVEAVMENQENFNSSDEALDDDLEGSLLEDESDDEDNEDNEDEENDGEDDEDDDGIDLPLSDEEGGEEIEDESDAAELSDEQRPSYKDTYISDPNGLNDGFFSIDDFNKQSQFLEQMDARGDDDNPSDEDEIDWDADPLSTSTTGVKTGKSKSAHDEDDDDSEGDGGPTFGDADLDASDDEDVDMVNGEDQELDGVGGMSNANEVRYADFFEPPPKKLSKTKRMRALPKTQPPKKIKDDNTEVAGPTQEQLENDLKRAMADVRRDLLDSEEELSEESEDDSDDGVGPRKPKKADKNMSTHEKQRAAIATEIRRLEAANVAKRDWQLSGEARAADRPVNSLIEEDLEFERTGKPIAPVTAETSEEIDALIKRRILAREFDEVIRRVPGSLNLASDTRRGRIELDDAKPQASLGEIYEAEHQKTADPLSYIDKRSAATKKKHAEIEILWKQVRDQLDLLSNMHFKPKRVDIEIKTVEDKPRIAMEDARPVGDIEGGEGGMLAPQEVYRPATDSRNRSKDEILLEGGAAISKEEMSRDEKLRRRRRDKERTKKAKGNQEVQVLGKTQSKKKPSSRKEKDTEKANIIQDLKRGGVKLVGKGGELQNIGKEKKGDRQGAEGIIASNLKL